MSYSKSADLIQELKIEFTEYPTATAIQLRGKFKEMADALAAGLPLDPRPAILVCLTSFYSDLWKFAKPLKHSSKK